MVYILGQIFKFVSLLNSEKGAVSISAGVALGMVFGFIPSNFLIIGFLFFVFFIFRVNAAAMGLSWAFFKIFAFLLDPVFDQVGFWLLTSVSELRPFWIHMYNMPIIPWSRFNNSIVLGSVVIGAALFVPCLLIVKYLVKRYRESVLKKITSSKWFQAWRSTTVYKLYSKYTDIREQF